MPLPTLYKTFDTDLSVIYNYLENIEDSKDGIVFKVDQLELMILDRYENNLYDKIEIKTQNNLNCLVYIEKNEALK